MIKVVFEYKLRDEFKYVAGGFIRVYYDLAWYFDGKHKRYYIAR